MSIQVPVRNVTTNTHRGFPHMYTVFLAADLPRMTGLQVITYYINVNTNPIYIFHEIKLKRNSHVGRSHFCSQVWGEMPNRPYKLLIKTSCKTAKDNI